MSRSGNSGSSRIESDRPVDGAPAGRCPVCTGCLKCKAASPSGGAGARRSVQDVVDAVTGATWGTRNRIMEGLFKEDLRAGAQGLPVFSSPGSPVKRDE